MLHIVSAQGQLLPEYGLPPVVEVALAIQLEGSIGFRSLDLATIVARWADQLPDVQERAPLPMMGPGPEDAEVTLEVIDETQTPRLWLQNEAGNRVLQLQQDRVVVNWQKGGTDDPYPRYASIRESLVEAWGRLMAVGGVLRFGHVRGHCSHSDRHVDHTSRRWGCCRDQSR